LENYIIACATDDRKNLVDRHFGDAERYELYRYSGDDFIHEATVENTVSEEKGHGDSVKAKNIGALLRDYGVKVLVSRQFGANLAKVRRGFVPVIARVVTIEAALELLRAHASEVEGEYQRGEERDHLVLRGE